MTNPDGPSDWALGTPSRCLCRLSRCAALRLSARLRRTASRSSGILIRVMTRGFCTGHDRQDHGSVNNQRHIPHGQQVKRHYQSEPFSRSANISQVLPGQILAAKGSFHIRRLDNRNACLDPGMPAADPPGSGNGSGNHPPILPLRGNLPGTNQV